GIRQAFRSRLEAEQELVGKQYGEEAPKHQRLMVEQIRRQSILHETHAQLRIQKEVGLRIQLEIREVARNREVPDGRQRRTQKSEHRRRQDCAGHVELNPLRRQLAEMVAK